MPPSHYNDLPGVHASPNIQTDPDLYEVENKALDPEHRIEAAMWLICPWAGRAVLDLGAGTGYYVPRFHQQAQHVFAVEPHGPSRLRIIRRAAQLRLDRLSILTGSAEEIPLRDASVDVVHARFAYFFAPGCEPGVRELARVIRPGGAAFIIDNDLSAGTFAQWLRQTETYRELRQESVDDFWREHGFGVTRIATEWRFTAREDLERVVRLEFGPALAPKLLESHTGLSVDYRICLFHKLY